MTCECENWLERQNAGLPARCEDHAAKMKVVGRVYEHPSTPLVVKRAIYQASDGFGPGTDPAVTEWDRSAIRDSSPVGVEAMYAVAFAYQKLDRPISVAVDSIGRVLCTVDGAISEPTLDHVKPARLAEAHRRTHEARGEVVEAG